jgi:hypothetical protein
VVDIRGSHFVAKKEFSFLPNLLREKPMPTPSYRRGCRAVMVKGFDPFGPRYPVEAKGAPK